MSLLADLCPWHLVCGVACGVGGLLLFLVLRGEPGVFHPNRIEDYKHKKVLDKNKHSSVVVASVVLAAVVAAAVVAAAVVAAAVVVATVVVVVGAKVGAALLTKGT